jgi:hypothetical protein
MKRVEISDPGDVFAGLRRRVRRRRAGGNAGGEATRSVARALQHAGPINLAFPGIGR